MEDTSLKDRSVHYSPFSSPNVAALLKIKIISWSQETGLPVSLSVRVADKTFNLHKEPIRSKSGYFKTRLKETNELKLPENFPGGAETFEMIALFVYGSSTLIDPFNVATLRCAAELLEMKEEYGSNNLCERTDLYLNQVVLQSWDDTIIVLQQCQTLLPLAEELLIVSRCIESLAFMACMEILDPERRQDWPVVTLEAFGSPSRKEFVTRDLWIKDLIALPFRFFKRIIGSLRRQGMKEKYVSPLIVFYANKSVLSKMARQCQDNDNDDGGAESTKVSMTLKGIIHLLPVGDKASRVIPVWFYFSLLKRSLEHRLTSEEKSKLQNQIAAQLHLAQVEDFLLPNSETKLISSSIEVATMESIFLTYIASCNMETNHTPTSRNSIVAELWDVYLTSIVHEPTMTPNRFMHLVEIIPVSSRISHDHLYRAMRIFLQAHPNTTQEEKSMVCKYLNCQKLSQEACIEAVQNELMPLRWIVQALFVQQLSTHQAFKECSNSFRYAHYEEFSGSLSSSRNPDSRSRNLEESPYVDTESGSRPLSFLLQKEVAAQKSEILSKKDYESTSFRIQNLEKELTSLKRSLEKQKSVKRTDPLSIRLNGPEGKALSRKRNPFREVAGCIGSVNFATQRKYVDRALKVLKGITSFGKVKSKRNVSPGFRTKPIKKN